MWIFALESECPQLGLGECLGRGVGGEEQLGTQRVQGQGLAGVGVGDVPTEAAGPDGQAGEVVATVQPLAGRQRHERIFYGWEAYSED